MLDRLLSLVGQGGVHSYTDLARQLDVTEKLLEQMLQDLARMGYLRRVGIDYEENCTSCPLSNVCTAGRSGQVWALTERGWRGRRNDTGGPEA